jgi:hypothetical protein
VYLFVDKHGEVYTESKMSNKRIYYAVQQVGISRCGENIYTSVKGLQQAGVNTRFNLEQVFEIGQISIYENIENIPDVEVTLEKVLDGYCPIYLLATKGASSATLSGRSNIRATIGASIYSDVQESASGVPLSQMTVSGVYVSSVSYSFNVGNNSTESVTLVGNNKVWNNTFTATAFNNNDSPLAPEGVNRREDVLFGSAGCLLPQDIPGISASGTNELAVTGDRFQVPIQSIRVSTNLGREQMFELGRKGPYHRYATFPVEVTTEIEVIATEGDKVSALEDASNLVDRTIVIKTREGLVVHCGSKNKLSGVTQGGANAGQNGGNMTLTYTYSNFNDMKVTHPQDPSGLT